MSTTKRGSAAGPEDAAIGQRVRELRGKTSQTTIANRIVALGGQMAQTYLSSLEIGERRWNSEYLHLVAMALGVRMADLMPDLVPTAGPGEMIVSVKPEEMAVLMILRTRGPKAAIQHLAGLLPDSP